MACTSMSAASGSYTAPCTCSVRAVDEADQITVVEIAEAVHLVLGDDEARETAHDLCRQLETEIHARGADMKEKIARRGDRMVAAADLAERMQIFRARGAEETIPGVGANAEHAGQPALEVAKTDGAQQAREIAEQLSRGILRLEAGFERHDQEDSGTRQPRRHRLRDYGR